MVDGAINLRGINVGITIKSPSWHYEESWSIKLDYALSNNRAKYEALILELLWALKVGVDALKVFSDSQVVVGLVNREYLVNFNNLRGYTERVNRLITQLHYFSLKKLDRSQNEAANMLAKLALEELPDDLGVTVVVLTMSTPVLLL